MKFMIHSTLIIFSFFLFSCTKNMNSEISPKTATVLTNDKKINNLSASAVIDQDKILNQDSPDQLDLGIIKENEINFARFYIKNSTQVSLSFIDESTIQLGLEGSAFSFSKTNCPLFLLSGKACFVEFKMTHNNLSYDAVEVQLATHEDNSFIGKIVIIGSKENTIINKNVNFIKMGQLNDINSDHTNRIYVKNVGDKVENAVVAIPAEYQLVKNDCRGSLPKNKSCFVDLKIKDNLDSNIIGINKPIEYDGHDFAITAGTSAQPNSITCVSSHTVLNNECITKHQIRECQPQPAHSENGYQESIDGGISWGSCIDEDCVSNYLDVGGFCVEANQVRSCVFPHGTGEEASSNGGVNWGLCTNLSCNMSYIFVTSLNSCEIKDQSRQCIVSNGVGSQSSVDGGVSFGTCNLLNCNTNYTNVGGSCLISNQVQDCTVVNGTGTKSSTDGGQTFGSCILVSCNANFTNVGGSCVATNQTQSCTISNGTGAQNSSDGGVSWGICNVATCNTNYISLNNSCVVQNQSQPCTVANGTGSQSSTDGGQNFGSCAAVSCNTSYTIVGGTCLVSNQTQSCTIANGTGTQSSTNGGQTFNTCTVVTCNSNYTEAVNSCVSNTTLACTDNTTCYAKKATYGKAIMSGVLLTTKDDLLYDSVNVRYLGSKCNNWYIEAEKFWANKILVGGGNNWLDVSYAFNSGANDIGTDPRTFTAPTCGTIHFREYKTQSAYGYAFLVRNGGQSYGGSYNGGGIGNHYNSDISGINKGDTFRIKSHYYAIGYLSGGYQ